MHQPAMSTWWEVQLEFIIFVNDKVETSVDMKRIAKGPTLRKRSSNFYKHLFTGWRKCIWKTLEKKLKSMLDDYYDESQEFLLFLLVSRNKLPCEVASLSTSVISQSLKHSKVVHQNGILLL